ncbi:dienelactone hydrolase family protein [Photorhabdus temperata]|uniref:Dienelactone hydrolase domain-containing protein n=2 Tax=Photorhabdus temperata TaxID=574560 RepID=A0A081RX91_PHOTE|nr:dienelactone hydrolase family protein [Photorhabdus temperata]ERT14791.1 hypothetical protein O185_01755 [Photorhabdus temperata J3]KER03294.1 hypothetical protein MEG1DRAFT_01971 [Photorhabdus temperata subsp. temperata Meg1]MCT8349098.1 dienelactone hydrolase family protein [Photorhabdus temperata]
MKFIFLTDIHGVSEHIKLIAKRLGGDGSFISPYEKENETPNNQEAMYEYFHNVSSIDEYTCKVRDALTRINSSVILIGFSIGAIVAWRLSNDRDLLVQHFICIFGSRIRDYLDVKPVKSTSLFFSNDEKYFIDKLKCSDRITVELVDCAHSEILKPNGCNIATGLINKALGR